MTVKELKKKLSEMPEDADIIFCNDDTYLMGDYYATDIEYDSNEHEARIVSDHKWRRDYDTWDWEG